MSRWAEPGRASRVWAAGPSRAGAEPSRGQRRGVNHAPGVTYRSATQLRTLRDRNPPLSLQAHYSTSVPKKSIGLHKKSKTLPKKSKSGRKFQSVPTAFSSLRTFIPNVPTLSDVLPSAHPPRKIIFYRSRSTPSTILSVAADEHGNALLNYIRLRHFCIL